MSASKPIPIPDLKDQLKRWWENQKQWKSKEAFAKSVNINERTLRNYFSGRNVPKGGKLSTLLNATGISFPTLIDNDLFSISQTGDNNMVNDHLSTETQKDKQPALLAKAEPNIETYKTIRIAVSGDVNLTKLECDLLDTRQFQRLHSIKQLGTSYLVYPSAMHTRFEHSLGTLFEADRLIQYIRNNKGGGLNNHEINKWDETLIRLAALLHDLSHIPFGHTLEDEAKIIDIDHDNDGERQKQLLIDSPIGKKLLVTIGRENLDLLIKILNTKLHMNWKIGHIWLT